MADFFQNGSITTLHNLTRRSIEDLERELSAFAQKRSIGLVLPSLYSELEGPALGKYCAGANKSSLSRPNCYWA